MEYIIIETEGDQGIYTTSFLTGADYANAEHGHISIVRISDMKEWNGPERDDWIEIEEWKGF